MFPTVFPKHCIQRIHHHRIGSIQRGKNPTRPVTMSGQQKTRFEQKKVKKINNIPFQNYYEKIQTIIQILRLCKYQFTHYSAHQVNVVSFIHIATMHLTKNGR